MSRGLMATACLLLLAILAFLFFIGPRTGWSKSAKTEAGKIYYFVSAEAPPAVQVAFIGAVSAFPMFILGSVLTWPRHSPTGDG